MPEPDDESRKKLGADIARAMVSGILAASARIDTFSTWLLGSTAGFLVLLVANIERAISVIKTGPVKAIIVVLIVSAVVGLMQKVIALYFYIQTSIEEGIIRKVSETVRVHSGENIADPYRYVREHVDFVHFALLFLSAFPKWLQSICKKMVLSEPDKDLSHRQKDIQKFVRQFVLVGLQIVGLLVSVMIVLCNL